MGLKIEEFYVLSEEIKREILSKKPYAYIDPYLEFIPFTRGDSAGNFNYIMYSKNARYGVDPSKYTLISLRQIYDVVSNKRLKVGGSFNMYIDLSVEGISVAYFALFFLRRCLLVQIVRFYVIK